MAMPNDFILIRHGQSESNIVQHNLRAHPDQPVPAGHFDRHDSHVRLSAEGESQAKAAGDWLREHDQDSFDRYYVSPHIRARETAAHLRINGDWRVDDRLRERDWGEYHIMEPTKRQQLYPYSNKVKDQSSWYWSPPGGESMATEARLRFESVLGSLHREMPGRRVVVVTHGEMMIVARFVLERLTPEEFMQQSEEGTHRTRNCQILHYSRIDPITGEQAPFLKWRRSINPYNSELSWDDGAWTEIKVHTFTDQQLLESVTLHERLLSNQGLE